MRAGREWRQDVQGLVDSGEDLSFYLGRGGRPEVCVQTRGGCDLDVHMCPLAIMGNSLWGEHGSNQEDSDASEGQW